MPARNIRGKESFFKLPFLCHDAFLSCLTFTQQTLIEYLLCGKCYIGCFGIYKTAVTTKPLSIEQNVISV